MITTDDPRHGSNRGYNAGCRDACCRTAHAKARKTYRARLYLEHTTTLHVPAHGVRRRLEALMALGWSTRQLDVLLGRQATYCSNLLARLHADPRRLTYLTTHREIAALYDRLSMTLPPTDGTRQQIVSRTRNLARRHGYAPPLAWDDIDNDTAPHPTPTAPEDRQALIDDVVVQRVIDGQPRPRKLTHAEATEAVRRLRARGVSTTVMEDQYGLKPDRYPRAQRAAS